MPNAFDAIARTPRGHFVLHLYAAVFRLLYYVERLSACGGEDVEALFKRYPFLGRYFDEMRELLPESGTWSEGARFLEKEILEWEATATVHLPLCELASTGVPDFVRRLAFLLVGLPEEDSRFGTLFADLQSPLTHRRPTLELVGQMALDPAGPAAADAWDLCRGLLDAGLVRTAERRTPRSEWVLEVPPVLWDAVRGEVAPFPAPGWRHHEPETFPALSELLVEETLHVHLRRLPDLLTSGQLRCVVLRGSPGADAATLLGAVARGLGRGLLEWTGRGASPEPWDELAPLASLVRAMPVLSYELPPGEVALPPALDGYTGPVGLVLGLEGGLDGPLVERSLTLSLEPPGAALRRRIWARELGEASGPELDAVAERFRLDAGYIRQSAPGAVAHAELGGRATVTVHDVRRAARGLGRQQLDTLATHLEPGGSWSRLVTGGHTLEKLRELELRCAHRERLLGQLGPAFGRNVNAGVRALFSGPSGTGKTLAAKILATELGLDLYRVDLAAVVNKYIGETEKNLHQVLSRAEALDVVLLLDEGDALLGQRTSVRSANDRYANLETNYLLQRLETFHGIVLVTTNLPGQIDDAFRRRMDVVVPFHPPEAEQRWRILELHLPEDHEVDPAYLERVAVRCALHGGQLRNAAFHATLLALDGAENVASHHLGTALESEYKKAGSPFPLSEKPTCSGRGTSVSALAAALGRQGLGGNGSVHDA